MCKVNKELTLFPLGAYKAIKISAIECDSFDEANKVLYKEYLRYRDMLSEADRERYDVILK